MIEPWRAVPPYRVSVSLLHFVDSDAGHFTAHRSPALRTPPAERTFASDRSQGRGAAATIGRPSTGDSGTQLTTLTEFEMHG